MVSITIYPIQIFIGFCIGLLSGGTLFALISTGDQWSTGFGEGWNRGCEYSKEKIENKDN